MTPFPEEVTDPNMHSRCTVCDTPMWGIIAPVKVTDAPPPRDLCEHCEMFH